jgi:hypothetical protein
MYILGCLRMYFTPFKDIRLYIFEKISVSEKIEKKHHLKIQKGISVIKKYLNRDIIDI